MKHPDWIATGLIYEVNVRSYTREGTFAAFAKHLPRLHALGVTTLWLMPVYPIAIERRNGTEGSHYAVRHYTQVNPDRGTLADLKSLVQQAHDLGMRVLFDWIANHTAWDHPWILEHPEWYARDVQGNIRPPKPEWKDVAQLDVNNREVWHAMTDAMAFWIRECDIDGFRCDVADYVPVEFWEQSRAELEKIKPLFYLAEADNPAFQRQAFNCAYGGMLYDFFHDLRQGKATAADIDAVLLKEQTEYPARHLMQRYIANHDSEPDQGNAFTLFGPALKPMAALCFALPGIPMIYSGMEAGLCDVIPHFEKAEICWDDLTWTAFFRDLVCFRKQHPALHGDYWNGKFVRILTNAPRQIYAFYREREKDRVALLINLSNELAEFTLSRISDLGPLQRVDSEESTAFRWGAKFAMAPWEYRFYTNPETTGGIKAARGVNQLAVG